MQRGSDWAHLVRLGALLVGALVAFLVIRPWFIPPTFGDIGFYRAAAVVEARDHPLGYAGRAACETCHFDVADLQRERQSRHAVVPCESCHGPLAAHADDPDALRPVAPDVTPLCIRCHEASAGRPPVVPQVTVADHSGGEPCASCHVPHVPGFE